MKQFRHGDILVEQVASLPQNVVVRPGAPVLANGEATGHKHRIAGAHDAVFYSDGSADGSGYFAVLVDKTRLVHEEHGPIELARGVYRFWHQREYAPDKIRRVVD